MVKEGDDGNVPSISFDIIDIDFVLVGWGFDETEILV